MYTHADSARSAIKNILIASASIIGVVLLLSFFGIKVLTIAASCSAIVAVFCLFLRQKCDLGMPTRHSSGTALRRFLFHSIEPDPIDPCKN